MKTFKKVIRLILLTFLIILAAAGMFATFLPVTRERDRDKETLIEQVDKMKDEEDVGEDDRSRK